MRYSIFPIGENAVTIDFGNEISIETNNRVIALAKVISRKPFAGLIETVPAYSSLTVFFDLLKVRQNYPQFVTASSFIENFLQNTADEFLEVSEIETRSVKIPVCFDEEFSFDLESIAKTANLTKEEVIEIFTAETYRVFMLGFLPAFAYMGEVNEKIAAPRRSSPRPNIEKGSVGIAGKQTGIYPLNSPGGWQIIGRTPQAMFQPQTKQISFLKAGDAVEFYQISRGEFDALKNK